jgi:hypothetical protein
MAMVRPPFETLDGQGLPTVRQASIFVDNRPGQLLRLTQLFEDHDVKILALSVVDSADCAVVRMLFDSPDEALKQLADAGWPVSVAELIVVKLPHGKRGLLAVWSALLMAELNIAYAYSLLPAHIGPAIALHVDNTEMAIDTLTESGFQVLSEADLRTRNG